MNTIFIHSENRKTSDPHELLLDLPDKMDLINMVLFQILAYTIHKKL